MWRNIKELFLTCASPPQQEGLAFFENKNGMSLPQIIIPEGGFKKIKISVPGHDNITFSDLKDIYK